MRTLPLHVSMAACAAAILPSVGHAATDAEVAALRTELASLKAEYAERMSALEAQIEQLQARSDEAAAVAAQAAPTSDAGTTGTAAGAPGANSFNPAISLILAGNYTRLSRDPEDYAIQGFIPPGDEIGPGERSFNLGETELTFSASIDPYFTGAVTAAITPENEIEIEEAFFRTLALPMGLTVKGGQFYSSLGYLNDVHAHNWDFIDQPLVYQALFDGQLAVQGLQLKWVAPLDLLLELGLESGNGDYFPGTRENDNNLNGVIAYAHLGGDAGDSIAWRTGLSYVDLDAEERGFEDVNASGEEVLNAFTGSSETWVVDAELRWTALADPKRRYLKLQGEYMRRREDGELSQSDALSTLTGGYSSEQWGWYLQGVFQFLPRWRVGARYDSLDSGDTGIGLVEEGLLTADDFPALLQGTPTRTTLMLDWSPSEFSRLRAQYAWDDAREGSTDQQFFLQYIYALGAHGAHKF